MTKARRLGLLYSKLLEDLAIARGYVFPGYDRPQPSVTGEVARGQFSDVELMACMLSPCLELPERVLCRGAWMLASLVTRVSPAEIVRAAGQARGKLVVRHVALLGCAIYPQSRDWRDLVLALPSTADEPVLESRQLHDQALRHVLATYKSDDAK